MAARDEIWRKYVEDYDIDVPKSAIQNELEYIKLDLRHRMQYDQLTGGDMHLFPKRELAQQEDELRAAALFEAKAPRVLKAIVAEQGFTATQDELEAEAQAIAEREGSTMDMVKRFFGEDLAMLERDVVERKAIDWACEQMR
ncbi:MAG TPA: hypothetical protein DCP91_05675 [Eggerthellaceae bacterium]|nr:hypothetical protein [Eggerthellaceae bacterium]